MILLRRRIALLIFCLMPWVTAFAAGAVSLYSADVPIANQTAALRASAITDAFKQVLVKVSGNAQVATVPAIDAAIAKAGDDVAQYRYWSRPDPLNMQSQQQFLRVTFSQPAVRQVLMTAGQAIWGADRPALMLWLAIQTPDQKILMSQDSGPAFVQPLLTSVQQRGLNVILPALDLTDLSAINFKNVWLQMWPQMEAAGKRYQPRGIIWGRVNEEANGQWQGSWVLHFNGDSVQWNTKGASLTDVMTQGVNNIANELAQRLSGLPTTTDKQQQLVEIDNIRNMNDFRRAMTLLKKLSIVDDVTVQQVLPKRILLQVQLLTSPDNFRSVLADDPHFVASLSGGTNFAYRLKS
jgi:uncharacterized protein